MKTRDRQVLLHIILLALVLISIFPIIFSISNSFKTLQDSFNNILSLVPKEFTLENYKYVFGRLPIFKIILNTFIIAFMVSSIKILTSILVAYSFVYYDFRGKNFIYLVFLATMFIPFTVTMIPNYLIVSKLKLSNTIWGVMLPQFAKVLRIFLLRQSMKTIPASLIEVSKIDGVDEWIILKNIILPIIKSSIVSTAIIFFINSWNEYVWSVLIISSQDNYTLSPALQMFISSESGTDFPIAMAVSVMTMIIPLILFKFSKDMLFLHEFIQLFVKASGENLEVLN
ncbi:carbohydrate ABC transporter permease [Peptoniphilus raoultii]|uniref:carbohydrate ABC transporter permease n=1 Tax=Peptoniphilus raoultii TaxID=1776387 RepID=UPI0008DAF903|nr:carbohydrate ABC transporter permease [Peptoniphilus raoultii]